MKSIEEMSSEECLQLIVRQGAEHGKLLRSMRRHLIVIAIPFWLSLCTIVAGVAFWLIAVGAVAGS